MLVILWAAFALTTAVIASGKGRSFIAWLALGTLFGIFALVAVCALPAKRG